MALAGRLTEHPILEVQERREFKFYYNDIECAAYEGEVISSSLFANGFTIFGHHYLDNSPQGIFCANGQCSQCMVIADGLPVKACMTFTKPGSKIYPCEGLPELPQHKDGEIKFREIPVKKCEVLIVGAGPSGIAAAVELGKSGRKVILVDDKDRPGGKLVLQTHTFFGSISDCYAGTRGIDIASILTEELKKQETVEVYLNASAIGVFADKKVGVQQGSDYFLIEPEKILIAAGAREKALSFPGWTLPGVYGAGAFQTLLNRDLVKPSKKLFIIGGGNVGIIAAYHAMQTGITVVGLAEALPEVGGYRVHADKAVRLGMPIYTSHSVVRADGDETGVKSVTIAQVDEKFKPIPGTEKTFDVDTILVAVGLSPIAELYNAAKAAGMDVYSAGDAKEIAEASAAMFGGKIAGLTIAADLGEKVEIPEEWLKKEKILKSKPGPVQKREQPDRNEGIFPVFHCRQEIPCNPCTEVCPHDSIYIEGNSLLGMPKFREKCSGCGKCVAICPGLAIVLVDFRDNEPGYASVTIPFELPSRLLEEGKTMPALDTDGNFLADAKITKIRNLKFADRTLLVTLEVPKEIATKVAGVRIQDKSETEPQKAAANTDNNENMTICTCMRVDRESIVKKIREGIRDLNHLKAELNVGMGACGGKTCEQLILKVFREEGIPAGEVVGYTTRPPVMEASLGIFAGTGDN